MVDDKLSEYFAYRLTIKRLLFTVGMWPNDQPSRGYRVLPVVQLVLNITTVFAIGGYIRQHVSDLARVIKGIGVMSSYLSSILKVEINFKFIPGQSMTLLSLLFFKTLCMIANRHEADELHQMLDPHFVKLLKKPHFPSIILNDVTTFRRLSWILSFLTYLTCFVFVSTPLILIAYQQLHHVYPIKYVLVVPGVYPWTIAPNSLLYKLHFVVESISSILAIVVSGGIDVLFSLYIFQIIGQFREMSYKITHIDEKNDCSIAVRECVLQHEILIKCRAIMEKIYGPVILWTMLVNAMNLCSQMFAFSQMTSISVQRVIFSSIYMMFKLIQTFLYSWAGLRLIEESEKYKGALYASNWYNDKRFMTSIIIMLTQKPLFLTACNFSVVTIDIFVKVVKTSISYFFALQTLQSQLNN